MKRYKYTIVALIAAVFTSCGDSFLDNAPTTKTPQENVASTVDNLYAALNGTHRAMYIQYDRQSEGGEASINIVREMLGEDLINPATGNGWYLSESRWISHRNEKGSQTAYILSFYYKLILNANLVLTSIDKAAGDDALRAAVKGEAYCFRAWAHFQLVQLYAKRYEAGKDNNQPGVPYRESTEITEPQARNTVEEVYKKINSDLDQAIELTKGYEAADVNHFSQKVAYGLKARVTLAQQNWKDAEKYADLSIQTATADGMNLQVGKELLSGFVSAPQNKEWMWASLMNDDQTIYFYSYFAFMSWNFNSSHIRQSTKCILDALYKKISPSDIRAQWWDPTGKMETPTSSFSKYPYQHRKFTAKSPSSSVGDVVYMRLAEMYLMKAEAEARSGNEAGAKATLLKFAQTRDPEYKLSTNSGAALIEEIMTQRRIELWGEGFRFTDLKRLNLALDRRNSNHEESVSQTMYVAPGDKQWQFLISNKEMEANPLMVQNEL
ncbi:MAG: RagB/SusD family nutrient uptake outer membrane protein [Tannerellaceae bacterium]